MALMTRTLVQVSFGAAMLTSPAVYASSAVTAGQFAVSESGAATVTVPIQVPRGIGGMEPQLSLNYSSGSGNGLLGLGWTLSGPSAITRCAKTKAIDGERGVVSFGLGDRYCLDGQRLIVVKLSAFANPNGGATADYNYNLPGNEYRTERDTFSRITTVGQYAGQVNVPSSFKVETKAGLVLDFGLSANSQVLTNPVSGGTSTMINRWLLQRISDRNGNFVEFVYCGGDVSVDGATCSSTDSTASGSKVLHYVRYTNRGSVNGTFAVVFGYEPRPDRIQGYHLGTSFRQAQRMARIETYRDFGGPGASARGKLVRGYDITYEPLEDATGKGIRATNASRVRQIQERDVTFERRAEQGHTLPALTFTTTPDAVFGQAVSHRPSASTGSPRPSEPCGGVVAGRRMMCP